MHWCGGFTRNIIESFIKICFYVEVLHLRRGKIFLTCVKGNIIKKKEKKK